MSGVELNFDASQVEPSTGSPDPLPSGKYPMMITASEMKATKDQTGAYLQLELTVIDGEFKGRKVWDRLNLKNNNPVAEQIARESLSAICHASGVIQCANSQQLHGIPMEVKVKYKPEADGYDASNDVKGYKPLGGAGGNMQGAQMAAPPQGQAAPWQQPAQQPTQQQAPTPQQAPPVQQQPWQQQQPPVQQPAPNNQLGPAGVPNASGGAPPWAKQPPATNQQPQQSPAANVQSNTPPWAQQQG